MAFIRRGKIRQKPTLGYRVVVVVGDDSETNEVQTVDVTLPSVEGQPVPNVNEMTLPLKVVKENGNKRFVYADLDFNEDAVNFSYQLTAVMKNADNQPVGDPFIKTVEVEDDGDSRLRSVSIRQLDDVNFRLKAVIVGDDNNEVGSLDISFIDFTGPEPIPTELSLSNPKVSGGKKVFKENTLTFDDPAAAADEFYLMIVDLKDAEGNSLGSTEYSVVVEGLDV